jgi:integrase
MDFRTQGEAWIKGLADRKRRPVKPGTLAVYRSYLNNWVIPRLGSIEIEKFGNAAMKVFAASFNVPNSSLGPKSINEVCAVVKQIISSAVNENGDRLYPRVWNHAFIDIPQVDSRVQKTPIPTPEQVSHAVRCSPREMGAFFALLAATGIRIGEAEAIRIGGDESHTTWDREKALICVRTQFYRCLEISPKTTAGYRDVDLHPRINRLLADHASGRTDGFLFLSSNMTRRGRGERLQRSFAKKHLVTHGLPGFHGLRRFRITRLRELGCPEDIIRYWVGHEGRDITDRYSKLAQNVELRRSWTDRVGYGFDLWEEKKEEVKKCQVDSAVPITASLDA